MLNPFPIQFLSMFAYFLLRFFVGSILIYLGISHYRNRHILKDIFVLSWFPYGSLTIWVFSVVEVLLGTLFILGIQTQYVALLTIAMSIKMLFLRHRFSHPTIPSKLFYLILFAASLSLFITGAGALAFDLPI